ncbi:MAG: iron-sulfur cluster assembly scaffold protein [Bacillota bacterium]
MPWARPSRRPAPSRRGDVLRSLGGLPEHKIHCSALGPAALRLAIFDYIRKSRRREGGAEAGAAEAQ